MRKLKLSIFYVLVFVYGTNAQSSRIVKGTVIDNYTTTPLANVTISIEGTPIEQITKLSGEFSLKNSPIGKQIVKIQLKGYKDLRIPITILINQNIELGTLILYQNITEQNEPSFIILSDEELTDNEGVSDNTAGLMQASKDIFQNTAAYEFSATFFRPKGYGSENGKVLINGIEMNKIYNGRPQWSNWGGLNDLQRNQVLANGLNPSIYTFGGISGSNTIIMRASEYKKGGRISYASSNRSYTGRVMASYTSGLTKNGWAFSFLTSRRYSQEAYNDATLYDSNSYSVSIEKKLNDKHSLNFTGFYTPNRRGKSSPNTQEVITIKGTKYNAYWGYQEGEKRNSRIREIQEPIFMLNHYYTTNEKTSINTNIAFQAGKIGNSRLDYGGKSLEIDTNSSEYLIGGGANPDPTYYQKLPSYFLRYKNNQQYDQAYLAEQNLKNNGQINWNSLYQANSNSVNSGRNAVYVLYEDRNDDQQFTLNSILQTSLKDNIDLNAKISYRKLNSENFASVLDVLGGNGYLNVDSFSETVYEAQNNLKNPNTIAKTGTKFKYHYEINATILDAFIQSKFQYQKIDFYVAGKISMTDYQRNGLYENGRFEGNASFGKSKKASFTNFSAKTGATYKISGRHLINLNAGYLTKAPTIRNTFSNSRENNDLVIGLDSEKIIAIDASYIVRMPKLKAKLTGYFTQFKDATNISFYYANGISGISNSETSAFVQEVLTGISKRNIGLEFGAEYQIIPSIKLKGVAAVGEYIYDNNPNLYLSSDDFDEAINYGEASLKNYHISGGPQIAASVGFEYRDPKYWWFGATTNYFSNAYASISSIRRTNNFSTNPIDGQIFNDYDPELAKQLLAQEQFDDYFLVNAVGGKSWKVNDYYIGFFATVNNILNTKYKTGGFEQSRTANYRTLREDKAREKPIFGSKYWHGYGTTYYLNVYFRF